MRRKRAQVLGVVGRAVAVVAVIVLLAIPAVFVNNPIGYVPSLAAVLVIGLAFGYVRVLRRSLAFDELSDVTNCERGRAVDFIVRLTNRSVLPFFRIEVSFFVTDLFGEVERLDTTVITLAPREVYDFQFQVGFAHIGTYAAGLQEVRVYDFLGLFHAAVPGTRSCKVEVAPRVFDISRLQTESEETPDAFELAVSANNDSMDYSTVRDYVWGDPIKAIHWKLSARTVDTYLTRLYESYRDPGIDVVLDFTAPQGHDTETLMCLYDAIVETAFSIRAWAGQAGMPCRLVYRSRSGEDRFIDARYDAWSALEAVRDMPRIVPCGEEGASAALELFGKEVNSLFTSNIAIISTRFGQELVSALVSAGNSRKHPVLFGVIPHGLPTAERGELLKPLRLLGTHAVKVFVLEDAEELEGGELL